MKNKKIKKTFYLSELLLILQSHKTHNLNTIKMREHLKQIDKDDIAGAILISVTVYITFYITSIIQSL